MKITKRLSAFAVYRDKKRKDKKNAKNETKSKTNKSDGNVSFASNNNEPQASTSFANTVDALNGMGLEAGEPSNASEVWADVKDDSVIDQRPSRRFVGMKSNKVHKSLSRSDPVLSMKSKFKRRGSAKHLPAFQTMKNLREPDESFAITESKKTFNVPFLRSRVGFGITRDEKKKPLFLYDSRIQARKCFEWLINPHKPDSFFKNIWEKKPLVLKRKHKDYFDHVFSTAEFDKILRENHIQFNRNIDVTSYVNGERKTHNPDGRAYPAIIWDYFQNGCSIRFLNPQSYSRSVWKLNSVLQEYFGSFVGANVYLTPAGYQGFAPHYDDIEAFILQIEGKKIWRIYAPENNSETLPRYSSGNYARSQMEHREPLMTVELEAGDLMYFPRGFIHEARTTDETHSMHITLSTCQKNTFGDLLEILLPQALQSAIEDDVEFRESLPRDYLNYMGVANQEMIDPQRYDFMAKMQTLMSKVMNYARIDTAIDQKAKQYIHDCLPPVLNDETKKASIHSSGEKWVDGKVKGAIEIEPDTQIKLIRHGVLRLVIEDETVRVYHTLENSRVYHEYEPQFIDIGADKAPAVEHLLRCYPNYVAVEQLPLDLLEDKMDIANLLYDKGLLMIIEDKDDSDMDE